MKLHMGLMSMNYLIKTFIFCICKFLISLFMQSLATVNAKYNNQSPTFYIGFTIMYLLPRNSHNDNACGNIFLFSPCTKDVMPSWLAEGRLKIFLYSSVKFNITLYNSIILLPINLWQITSHTCHDINWGDQIDIDFSKFIQIIL